MPSVDLSDVRLPDVRHLVEDTSSSNWEKLQDRELREDRRYQDVYNQQQLDRSQMPTKQTPFTRNVLTGVLVAVIALLLWLLMAGIQWVFVALPSMTANDVSDLVGLRGGSSASMFAQCLLPIPWWKVVIELVIVIPAGLVIHELLMRNLQAQNLLTDPSDINQYQNDQHIALPEEVQRKFDWFPDVGGHSSVLVSSMISHVALSNKGLKKIDVVERHAEDNDDTEFYAAILGDEDELDIVRKPMIDVKFSRALFEASGVPADIQKVYDATQIPYNPGNKNREKLKNYDTVADMINGDWEFPLYEPQRPGGAYLVDTDPVNTMVLAITRAGKGQTVIEPTIDMWLREKRPNNIVINDPKGELLVKNYVPAAVRGFQPVQFNLINAMKTDIYNPLVMAAQAAREGDSTKCALYVENIADVFFPLEGGEDPVWPNAANNAFKRAAYGLIDYYLEEERILRARAAREHMDAGVLDTKIDELWGHVTLYNCYQLFVQLTAKKEKNPTTDMAAVEKKCEAMMAAKKEGKPVNENDPDWIEYQDTKKWNKRVRESNARAELWDGAPTVDLLTLYFNATERLPRNSMRTLVGNANNALKAMGGAEKMMASVYGIAITAMSFFADPTISTLTSGTPSQNADLAGLSFPRRIGVQLHPHFIERYHLTGLQARWQAFKDPNFTEKYEGKDFFHEDLISREGWARFFFKGIFPNDTAYMRLQILNAQTDMLVKTFYFKFTKAYQKSLDGRRYVNDPVLDCKIVKNGLLTELVKDKEGNFRVGKTLFKNETAKVKENGEVERVKENTTAIISDIVRYAEKPKIVFLVTPPHLMKYAKLILILIKQLVDLNFDQSYMTKSDQKPLYKTRFMLDELGNLQSEGHGISGFETMLSIGLGQEQQFTLILQTLQQLRDVYGESVDKIVQGNAQPLDAKIATPAGWKRMGDMAVGDKVLLPKGGEAQVKGVYPRGVRKVYKVTLKDGTACRCCNEHLWKVKVS